MYIGGVLRCVAFWKRKLLPVSMQDVSVETGSQIQII